MSSHSSASGKRGVSGSGFHPNTSIPPSGLRTGSETEVCEDVVLSTPELSRDVSSELLAVEVEVVGVALWPEATAL